MLTKRRAKRGHVVYERDGGWWVVSRPGVPGAYSQGKTRASARRNLADAERMLASAVGTRVTVPLRARFAGTVIGSKRGRVIVELHGGECVNVRASEIEPIPLRRSSVRRELGLAAGVPLEYHATEGRPLTPDEKRFAEDRQILDEVATGGPDTVKGIAGGTRRTREPPLRHHPRRSQGDRMGEEGRTPSRRERGRAPAREDGPGVDCAAPPMIVAGDPLAEFTAAALGD